ncbi:MAG TPA: hypothetical protein VLF87_01590 [Patescibacteria group bacterium]|nr:hypothetical protein [Patescibacteria group bacterium]
MCKLLAELVGTDRQVMREMIVRLEHSSGDPGVDLRLSGEIYGALHMKVRALGLDPNDTTPKELYLALQNLASLHDGFLASRLGIENKTDAAEILSVVTATVQRMHIPKQCWSLKAVAAKRLLQKAPPKTLMKALNYRSVDSMLKREPAEVLLTVARHLESATWQKHFIQHYKKLHSSDFETKPVIIASLNGKRWLALGENYAQIHHSNILHNPEAGCVVVMPLPQALPGLTLVSLLLILHYITEIRMHSTYFKFHHLRPDFSDKMITMLTHPEATHGRIAGQPVHWRVIHRYYGSAATHNHPEIFQPHIQPEDMAYRKAEHILYHLEPALHFWHQTDCVGLPQEGGPSVSFNLMDVAINLLNGLSYERRVDYHVREAVWNELFSRYLGQQALERELTQRLDDEILSASFAFNELEFAV